ncbi:ABC transporter ATP-binding protein [Ferrimicrobium sp.]|uniref:ABC transporter ATP-binding protein n=1 Tax=Ferrimicrobium sp. TaxID=2926050 RepID=UPI00260F6616|nr:ABC transporter ATP-binding protein [Ferrimicrobium sp.]
MILELNSINTYYDRSHVLQGVSLSIEAGEVVGLLGRNGAGKTTTLRSVTGLTPPRSGTVSFEGTQIQGKPAYRIASMGVGLVPSGRRVFGDLTVRQNLVLAAKAARKSETAWDIDRVVAAFPKLAMLMDRRAGVLSGGEAQMVKLGRALLGNPKLLLLDEPSEGLAPTIVEEVGRQLHELKNLGMSMLISEQNMGFALSIIDRGYVLEKGRIRLEATAVDLRSSDEARHLLGV